MKLLVIFAHPNHRSLNYAFLQEIVRGSGENAAIEEIEVLDLYADGFDPVLVFNEEKGEGTCTPTPSSSDTGR